MIIIRKLDVRHGASTTCVTLRANLDLAAVNFFVDDVSYNGDFYVWALVWFNGEVYWIAHKSEGRDDNSGIKEYNEQNEQQWKCIGVGGGGCRKDSETYTEENC